MRIALKPVTANLLTTQTASPKQSGASFLDMLTQATSDAIQSLKPAAGNTGEQPDGNSNSPDESSANDSSSQASQGETNETAHPADANSSVAGSVVANTQTRNLVAASAASKATAIVPERVTPSPAPKTTQAQTGDQPSSPIQNPANQDASQQIPVAQPALIPVQTTGNDAKGGQAAAPRALPAVLAESLNLPMPQGGPQPAAGPATPATPAAQPSTVSDTSDAGAGSQFLAAEFTFPVSLAAASTFAPSASLSKNGSLTSSASETSQAKNASTAATVNSAATPAAGTATAAKGGVPQESFASQHAGQSDGQNAQPAQGTALPTPSVSGRAFDPAATQTIAFTTHATSAMPATARATSPDAAEAPTRAGDQGDLRSELQEASSAGGNAGINTAQLIQSMSGSEMRVGMRSAEFGDISIRTSVSPEQLQAQINVDHSELNSAITAHIPSLQARLGSDFGLHTSIEINQLGGFHSNGQGQASQQNQNLRSASATTGETAQSAETDALAIPAPPPAVGDGRLDIRI